MSDLHEPAKTVSRRTPMFVGAGVLVVAAVIAFAVTRKGPAVAQEPPRDVPTFDGKWIRFSPAFATRSEIAFTKVESGALSPVVNVTGTVDFDPERVAVIGARIAGRVHRIAKFAGDPVKAGEVLAEIESAELGQAQSALSAAKAHAEAATVNERRETDLAEAHVSSARDAELARAAAASAKAELNASQQRVRALGGDRVGDIGVLLVTSPIAGKIVDSHVSRGQSVEPSATLFKVADLSRVWIELAVFERELAHIRPNDTVEITPQTNTSVVLKGTVAHVGDVINLETRSSDVRVVVDNAEGALRPGQSVLARIHTKTTPSAGFLLPREALTTVDGKSTVFVSKDANAVEPRIVVPGSQDGVKVEIVSGLTAGESVVVKGVFALKSEIFR
ncbi:MAG: efflux RND transporter periplasmic adaptor subunit [Polyangiaceae bacterium]